MTHRIRSKSGGGGGTIIVTPGGTGFTDEFSMQILFNDSIAGQTDAAAFALALAQGDTVDPQTEAVSLAFPSPDFIDTTAAPTDATSVTLRAWLSASAGGTNPNNANGENNGTVATLQTAPAGTNPIVMTSNLGNGVPTVSIASVIFRGWFKSVNTLVTSTTTLKLHSSSALFADVTMFTNAALNTTVDHLTGDFTFDVLAAGINTLAKIQSIQLVCTTNDAVAGVTPAVLTVDAGTLEIAGAF